jgi:hypothetical protein
MAILDRGRDQNESMSSGVHIPTFKRNKPWILLNIEGNITNKINDWPVVRPITLRDSRGIDEYTGK